MEGAGETARNTDIVRCCRDRRRTRAAHWSTSCSLFFPNICRRLQRRLLHNVLNAGSHADFNICQIRWAPPPTFARFLPRHKRYHPLRQNSRFSRRRMRSTRHACSLQTCGKLSTCRSTERPRQRTHVLRSLCMYARVRSSFWVTELVFFFLYIV